MEKIAITSTLILNVTNYKARIPIVYGNNSSEKITITISNEDNTRINTIEIPLENGQTLSATDYIDSEGIHINGVQTNFTADQQLAFENLQDIVIYPNYTKIASDCIMRIYYYKRNEEDNQIYVLDKYEQLIAVFNVDDEETLINPRITKTQNEESTFIFSISLTNSKWEIIQDPENLYMLDGMVFSTNFDSCFKETISSNDEKLVEVTAYERQKLLSRKYVRAWNSETDLETIDTFMVVVLSGGDLPLKNDGEYVSSSHLPGTSGYALDALLYGTGWATGTCDVEGTFDLETDQVDIYENILKVQEIWGGILVFDSVNKTVSHRDETKWLPYNGYEAKYAKNMQSLEKLYNNKIITKLCPLGESGLNIESVNGSVWLEDYSYTTTVLEGIENNSDITNPEQLMRWGQRKLKDLCKPTIELTVEVALLYQLEGYELETIDLNDIVDVKNYNDIEGDTEQLRVVGFEYGKWDKSDATLTLSDITLDSTDIFKKSVRATNSINAGTLDSSKIITYYKNGQSVNETIRQIDTTIKTNKSDLIKADDVIEGRVALTEESIDTIRGEVAEYKSIIEDLKITINGLKNTLTAIGGSNLIKNSVGYFGTDYWEGNIIQYVDTDVMQNNESNSSLSLQNGSIVQEINNIKNGYYNISFNYKKLKTLSDIRVKIKDTEYMLNNESWTAFEENITITDNYFRIEFKSDIDDSCLISDLILIVGSVRQTWSQNSNETITDAVSIGKGIQVESSSNVNTYTRIDADGNRTFNKKRNETTAEMTDEGIKGTNLNISGNGKFNVLLFKQVGEQGWINGTGG